MRIIWGKPKRHRPNPKKVRWNRIRRMISRILRNMILVLIIGGSLAIIYFY